MGLSSGMSTPLRLQNHLAPTGKRKRDFALQILTALCIFHHACRSAVAFSSTNRPPFKPPSSINGQRYRFSDQESSDRTSIRHRWHGHHVGYWRHRETVLQAAFQSTTSQDADWQHALDKVLQQHKSAPPSDDEGEKKRGNQDSSQHLAFLFVSPSHTQHFEQIVKAASQQLDKSNRNGNHNCKTTLVAMITEGVVGDGHEYDDSNRPSMSLFMGMLPNGANIETFTVSSDAHDWKDRLNMQSHSRITASEEQSSTSKSEPTPPMSPMPDVENSMIRPDSFMVFSDPYCSKLSQTLQVLDETDSIVTGGISARLQNRSRPTLAVGGQLLTPGSLIGVRLGGTIGLQTVLAQQGSRALGGVYSITSIRGNAILELNNRPALDQLEKVMAECASDEDRNEIRDFGMLCGILKRDGDVGNDDVTADDPTDNDGSKSVRGSNASSGSASDNHSNSNITDDADVLVRQVTGYRPYSGSFLIAGDFKLGDSVQFHARNQSVAKEDVHLMFQRAKVQRMMHDSQANAGSIMGILQISSVARGTSLFGVANVDHDSIAGMLPAKHTLDSNATEEDGTNSKNHAVSSSLPLSLSSSVERSCIGGFFANGEIGATGFQMGPEDWNRSTSNKDARSTELPSYTRNTYIHGFAVVAAAICDYSRSSHYAETTSNASQAEENVGAPQSEGDRTTVPPCHGAVDVDRRHCWE